MMLNNEWIDLVNKLLCVLEQSTGLHRKASHLLLGAEGKVDVRKDTQMEI